MREGQDKHRWRAGRVSEVEGTRHSRSGLVQVFQRCLNLASHGIDAAIGRLLSSFRLRTLSNRTFLPPERAGSLESDALFPKPDRLDCETDSMAAFGNVARAEPSSSLASTYQKNSAGDAGAIIRRASAPLKAVSSIADSLANTRLDEEQQRYVSALRSKSRELTAILSDALDDSTKEAVAECPTVPSERFSEPRPLVKALGRETLTRKIEFAQPARDLAAGVSTPLAGAKVLLLDSKEDERLAIKQFLVANQAEVEEADGALEALLALAQASEKGDPFSLAIIDGRLSRVTGLDTARRILGQEWAAGLPIVLLTGGLGPDDLEDVESLPVRCFSGAPSDAAALLAELGAALAGQPRRKPASSSRLRRILIVDDNAINLFLASDFLKDLEGFEVETAEGGEMGLERALSKRFDLVLMDMQMPVVDGQTATREIRRHEVANGLNRTPIIAFTAHSAASELEAARQAGCDAHLIKPAKKEKMIATVLSLVGPLEPSAHSASAKIRAEGNDRLRQHMSGYLSKLAESLARAEAALAERDFKTVREIVHKWIGPSASLGIPELSDEGGLLQDAARFERAQLCRKQLRHTREYAARLEIVYSNGDALTPPLSECAHHPAAAPREIPV